MTNSSKKFSRKIEDFTCINCGKYVVGNGYTNHCPNCLYSLHVDINPGDRLSDCKGIMIPLRTCGVIKKVKADKSDNKDLLIKLLSKV
ncbi:MAG: RNHCP domain-containing protein [Candidatus Helarchaeota archaeon]